MKSPVAACFPQAWAYFAFKKSYVAQLVLAVLTLGGRATTAVADGWVLAATDSNGASYYYEAQTLKREGLPPTAVTARLAAKPLSGAGSYLGYQTFDCVNKTVKAEITPVASVIADTSTVQAHLFAGFCGLTLSDGRWFVIGAVANPDTGQLRSFLFINGDSLTNDRYEGLDVIRVEFGWGRYQLASNVDKIYFTEKGRYYLPCSGRVAEFWSVVGDRNQTVTTMKVIPGQFSEGLSNLVCRGYFEVSVRDPAHGPVARDQSDNRLNSSRGMSPAIDMHWAKQKCAELGFKAATESFGKCVLQLSR